MNSADANKPIVVKRVKKYAAGAHGGAWKVAFADFVTAMMALFLVLWLIESTTPAEKMAISMYFSDPTGYTDGGSPFVINMGGGMRNTDAIDRVSSPAPPTQEPDVLPDKNIQPNLSQEAIQQIEQIEQQKQLQEMHEQQENNKFEELKQMLEERIEADPTLGALKDQIIIKITEEGLMIEVVDKDKRPMFDSGGDVIKPYMRTILKEISKTLHDVPNPLSISGHTDAVPFTEIENYTNWELSADRANAARRAMLRAGIKEKQIARVVGLADSQLYDKDKPENPINRRISILAMRTPVTPPPPAPEKAGDSAKKDEAATDSGFPGGVMPGVETSAPAPKPAIDPSLPPDADFPGGAGATESKTSGVPESVPAVPAGMKPEPVLTAPGPSTTRTSSTPPPVNLDPFSTLPINTGSPDNAAPASPASAPARASSASSATAAPAAAAAPARAAPERTPASSAPPASLSAPSRAAEPAQSVVPTVTVPRPSAPDEEFF